MTIVSRNFILARALDDKILSEDEIKEFLDIVFDQNDPFGQVDSAIYANVDATLESIFKDGIAFQKDSSSRAGVDTDNEKILRYLASGFPGSLQSFKLRLSRTMGITLPDFTQHQKPLAEITLKSFARDTKKAAVYHFAVSVAGTDYSFDYDTSLPMAEQVIWQVPDTSKRMAAADTFSLLHDMDLTPPENGGFNEEQRHLYNEFNGKRMPYPIIGTSRTETNQAVAALIGPDVDQLSDTTKPFPESERVTTNGALPVYADKTITSERLTRIWNEAQRILGDGVMSFLTEQGVTLGFYDFDGIARANQRETVNQATAEYDVLRDGAAGFYHFVGNKICLDTHQPENYIITSVIHEVGHAVNFLTQKNNPKTKKHIVQNPAEGTSQEPFNWALGGAQRSAFVNAANNQNLPTRDTFDSGYATSNEIEWFAEKFLYVMLERAGRMDLLKENPDHNPLLELSPILVDPNAYLLVTKIVTTIENRATDKESYDALMAKGIDESFLSSCQDFAAKGGLTHWRGQFGPQLTKIKAELAKSGKSATLAREMAQWQQIPISEIYQFAPLAATADAPLTGDSLYEDWVQDDFAKYKTDDAIRSNYTPNADGQYSMQFYVERLPDFKAIYLAVQMSRTDIDTAAKGKILYENGIENGESLTGLYDQLTVLSAKDLDPLLNQDALFAAAAQAANEDYAQRSYIHQQYMDTLNTAANALERGDAASVLPDLKRMARAYPKDMGVHTWLAIAYALSDQSEDAAKERGSAVTIANGDTENLKWLCDTYASVAANLESNFQRGKALMIYRDLLLIPGISADEAAGTKEKIAALAKNPKARDAADLAMRQMSGLE